MKPRSESSKWLFLGVVVFLTIVIAFQGCAPQEVAPPDEPTTSAAGGVTPIEEEPAGGVTPTEEEEAKPTPAPTPVPPSAAVPTLDQNQVSTPGNTGLEGAWVLSQGFIPSIPILTSVEVYIGSVHANLSYPLTLQVRDDSNGLPSGTILASTSITVTREAWEWKTFGLPNLSVDSGTRYHIVLYSVSNYHVGLDPTDPYPHGYMGYSIDTGATWEILHNTPDYDMAFKIYGILSEETPMPTPSPPSIQVELGVDSVNPEGVKFIAPESGLYKMTILGGAYCFLSEDEEDWAIYGGWRTMLYLYINREVKWGAPDEWGLHPINPDNAIGPDQNYPTTAEAETAGQDTVVMIDLDKGGYVIALVSDGSDYYSDNSGIVEIRISGP